MHAHSAQFPVRSKRPAGSGRQIVTASAEDRAREIRRARRHSAVVRLLKVALPAGALAVSGIYAALFLQMSGLGVSVARLPLPKVLPEHLTMRNPRYEGFSKDGGAYVFTADSAAQSLTETNRVALQAIKGRLTDAKNVQTELAATRGTFDTSSNVLDLVEGIRVSSTNGLEAELDRATVQTKENIITSDVPVKVAMPAGRIQSNRMTIRQKSKEITFVDAVVAHLVPAKKPDAAVTAAPAPAKPAFGNPDQPVDITATRLDISDTAKTAVFSGSVRAAQGDSVLTSPELTVTYEGEPGGSSEPSGGAAGVKRIAAAEPVVLTRGASEQITSNRADFDAAGGVAILSGNVVMASLPDSRASGDRLEFDSKANTVLITGTVNVSQGRNTIQGRRLFLDRAAGKTQVSSPTDANQAAGQIRARFYQGGAQQTGTPAAPATPPDRAASNSSPLGGQFKTDPNAPIDVDADTLDVDDSAKLATFRGNVFARQAEFSIRAAQLQAFFTGEAGLRQPDGATQANASPAQVTRIEAKINVVVRSGDGQTATGDWARFDVKGDKAVIGGNVTLTQGKNLVRGTRLVIDMKTGQSVVETGQEAATQVTGNETTRPATARPSAIFFPKQGKDRIKKELDKAGASTSSWEARTEP